MCSQQHLIIFVKNPVEGKVKTRLAKAIGREKALLVYKKLLQKTLDVVSPLGCQKSVFYSEYVDENDIWPRSHFEKQVQTGIDLGHKMLDAFQKISLQGYKKIVLIGSDCYELTPHIIDLAFQQLDAHEIVIGPAKDGGYYLIGMKRVFSELLKDKPWSQPTLLQETLAQLRDLKLKTHFLTELNDVDDYDDLLNSGIAI